MRPSKVIRPLWLLALAAGSALISYGSVTYFDAEELPPFVIEKLPLPMEEVWLGALKVHVVAAAFALPACLLLSLAFVLKRFPGVHRWLGRATGVVVLFALVPSGFYLSLFAKGGLAGTLGFMLSGAIVGVAMVRGVITARAGEYVAHRRWVMHVLGQMAVAVVSRALMLGLDAAAFDPERSYLIALWAPVLGAVALVELLVPRPSRRKHHEAVSRPVVSDAREPGLGVAV